MSNVITRINHLRAQLNGARDKCFRYPNANTKNSDLAKILSDIIDETSRIELDYQIEKQR